MGKKIGIMGGTFNPIHNGHLLLAEAAWETFGLDGIIFMPSGNPYMKNASSILPGSERVHMIRLAIEGNPHFSLSDMEIRRKGPTYTCDTLKELKGQNPNDQYYFIMGADSLLSLDSWKNPGLILQSCTVIVSARSGTDGELRNAAQRLILRYGADIRILPERFIDISSSQIRRLAGEGSSIRYMVPEKVFAYITTKGLYTIVP